MPTVFPFPSFISAVANEAAMCKDMTGLHEILQEAKVADWDTHPTLAASPAEGMARMGTIRRPRC
jgi:hypothetical protein